MSLMQIAKILLLIFSPLKATVFIIWPRVTQLDHATLLYRYCDLVKVCACVFRDMLYVSLVATTKRASP